MHATHHRAVHATMPNTGNLESFWAIDAEMDSIVEKDCLKVYLKPPRPWQVGANPRAASLQHLRLCTEPSTGIEQAILGQFAFCPSPADLAFLQILHHIGKHKIGTGWIKEFACFDSIASTSGVLVQVHCVRSALRLHGKSAMF